MSIQNTGAGDAAPGPRVLVAEDNRVNRELILAVLRRLGYQATGAADGAEAVALFDAAETPFDLVLLDLNMPGVGGAEAARELHGRPVLAGRGRPVPLVLMTAETDVIDHLTTGLFSGYVAKPLAWNDLDALIKRLVGLA
ncbi:response regulator [Nitrospirillum sp. BR 11164]|uniref:response regulator n=1 Tax=Nitrospirillum sp. BR 11164 TaxID=3104324 RepID=UPI002AFE6892|nr:response regulator [Nitrospirillum sp. BR 11164]MEA1650822.1 response regulator [Nitrospirillum sp. BR 11164]